MKKTILHKIGWFIFGTMIVLIGLGLNYLIPFDPTAGDSPAGGSAFVLIGIGMIVYSFFAKRSIYEVFHRD